MCLQVSKHSMGTFYSSWYLIAPIAALVLVVLKRVLFPTKTALSLAQQYGPRHLQGKTVLITGAYSGIGVDTTRACLRMGARVLIGCRDERRQEAFLRKMFAEEDLKQQDRLVGIPLDLGDLESVRDFCDQVQAQEHFGRIDVAILNAGIMMSPYRLTKQGIESQTGVNVLAHFYLARLLLPNLLAGDKRLIFLTSCAHGKYGARRWSQATYAWLAKSETYHPEVAYQQSKLGDLLLAQQFHKRFGLDSVGVHPGIATQTGLYRNQNILQRLSQLYKEPMMVLSEGTKSVPEAAATSIYAAGLDQVIPHGPTGEHSAMSCLVSEVTPGGYYADCKEKQAARVATDFPEDGEALWSWCEDTCRNKGFEFPVD